MDQQVQYKCSKQGHENKLIEGICTDPNCNEQIKFFCIYCIIEVHNKCNSLKYLTDKDLKFELQLLRDKMINNQQNEINIDVFESIKRELTNHLNHIDDRMRKINDEQKQSNVLVLEKIEHIHKNQLTEQLWKEGYDLITKKVQPNKIDDQDVLEMRKANSELNKLQTYLFDYQYNLAFPYFKKQQIKKSNWISENIRFGLGKQEEYHSDIFCIACSPSGIAYAGSGKTIHIWNPEESKEIYTLRGHRNSIFDIKYSPDFLKLATASYDGSIKIWDLNTQKDILKMNAHLSAVNSISYSPTLDTLVSGSRDKSIRVWDCRTGRSFFRLETTGSVYTVQYSPDGKYILSATLNHQTNVYDIQTNNVVHQIEDQGAMAFYSPDGKYVITNGQHKIQVWNSSLIKATDIVMEQGKIIESFSFTSDGSLLASASKGKVKLWDFERKQQIGRDLQIHYYEQGQIAFSMDNYHLVAGSKKCLSINDLSFMGLIPGQR